MFWNKFIALLLFCNTVEILQMSLNCSTQRAVSRLKAKGNVSIVVGAGVTDGTNCPNGSQRVPVGMYTALAGVLQAGSPTIWRTNALLHDSAIACDVARGIKGAVSRFLPWFWEVHWNIPRYYTTQQKWFYSGKHHSTNDNILKVRMANDSWGGNGLQNGILPPLGWTCFKYSNLAQKSLKFYKIFVTLPNFFIKLLANV